MQIYRIIVSDGRKEYFEQTMRSFFGFDATDHHGWMTPTVQGTIISDDSQNPEFAEWLDTMFKGYPNLLIGHHPSKIGLCASIDWAWKQVPPEVEFIQHLEEDFILEKAVDLEQLAYCLNHAHWLSQIWLMRGPWYKAEHEAGSIYNHRAPKFWEVRSINHWDTGWPMYWTQYNAGPFWTQNPCLYSTRLIKHGYHAGPYCEEAMAHWAWDHGMKTAFWGRPDETPFTKHIGVISNKVALY